jgi:hypothetical protein
MRRQVTLIGMATVVAALGFAAPAAAVSEVQLESVSVFDGGGFRLQVDSHDDEDQILTITGNGSSVTVTDTGDGADDVDTDTDPADGVCNPNPAPNTVTCTSTGGPLRVVVFTEMGNDTIDLTGATYTSSSVRTDLGEDAITGGTGNDFGDLGDDAHEDDFNGGLGRDGVTYEDHFNPSGVSVDLDGARDDGPGGLDRIGGDVEMITGTAIGNDTLAGDDDDNVLVGGCCRSAGDPPASGTETLIGNGGNDELGGRRDQTMLGGEGNDLFVSDVPTSTNSDNDMITGGSGVDTVQYLDAPAIATAYAPHTVNLGASSNNGITDGTAGPPDENDTYVDDLENFIGGEGSDTVTGNGLPNLIDVDNDLATFFADTVTSCGGGADVVESHPTDIVDEASCETIIGGGGGGPGPGPGGGGGGGTVTPTPTPAPASPGAPTAKKKKKKKKKRKKK